MKSFCVNSVRNFWTNLTTKGDIFSSLNLSRSVFYFLMAFDPFSIYTISEIHRNTPIHWIVLAPADLSKLNLEILSSWLTWEHFRENLFGKEAALGNSVLVRFSLSGFCHRGEIVMMWLSRKKSRKLKHKEAAD